MSRPADPAMRRSVLRRIFRRPVYAVARRLSPERREPLLRLARAAGDLVSPRPATPAKPKPAPKRPRYQPPPARFTLAVPPPPVPESWPEPPYVDDPFDHVEEPADDAGETRFDIELFERLNKEYETKPLVPVPLQYDADAIFKRSRTRLLELHRLFDLSGKRVLEIGCGAGYEIWLLAHHFGSEAWGIDISQRNAWRALSDDRTRFVEGDIATDPALPSEYFDRIISTTVWEHVVHPFAALRETYRVLKPGGLAWIRANLYRSAMASHLYREINFPYPHLLFSDEVFREFYRRRGEAERPSVWVNKLTWPQYERYFDLLGFNVKMATFTERALDEEFYRRFSSVLGRYPRSDLTKDFFTVILERPAE